MPPPVLRYAGWMPLVPVRGYDRHALLDGAPHAPVLLPYIERVLLPE
jgi:hypothetical protein